MSSYNFLIKLEFDNVGFTSEDISQSGENWITWRMHLQAWRRISHKLNAPWLTKIYSNKSATRAKYYCASHNHMCILAKAQPQSGGIGVNQHQQRLYKNDYMQEQENVKQ